MGCKNYEVNNQERLQISLQVRKASKNYQNEPLEVVKCKKCGKVLVEPEELIESVK